jgi:hypothetical protein
MTSVELKQAFDDALRAFDQSHESVAAVERSNAEHPDLVADLPGLPRRRHDITKQLRLIRDHFDWTGGYSGTMDAWDRGLKELQAVSDQLLLALSTAHDYHRSAVRAGNWELASRIDDALVQPLAVSSARVSAELREQGRRFLLARARGPGSRP